MSSPSADDPLLALMEADEAEVRRLLPPCLPRRAHDVYVTRETRLPAQLARAQAALDGPAGLVWIHGLGAAQSRAVNLALTLAARNLGRVELSPLTSTVTCVDLVGPGLGPPSGQTTRARPQSAVHIRVGRPGGTQPSTTTPQPVT